MTAQDNRPEDVRALEHIESIRRPQLAEDIYENTQTDPSDPWSDDGYEDR